MSNITLTANNGVFKVNIIDKKNYNEFGKKTKMGWI